MSLRIIFSALNVGVILLWYIEFGLFLIFRHPSFYYLNDVFISAFLCLINDLSHTFKWQIVLTIKKSA
ncbi:hypothetical protein CZ787_05685 [Halomonas citrativorans]|uniref:Uncharacterized protein n=1 Tax=Halomonas citrativorans TaxID=2742612 RepID=A0A1R4HV06_9GAMM|nr:hypothetical protein CZ787_05685 [Halomonas citrativorans]